MAQGPVAYAWGRRTGRPYVVSPRGTLQPWALKYRGWKKRLVLWAWERRVLDGAACLHATSEEEAAQFRVLGLTPPITVIPNGMDVPRKTDRDGAGDRVAAFLSRVHPIKGLPMLLHAWATVRPARWRLVIAGPDECGHTVELRRMASELGLGSQVEFRGPVYGDAKWDLLRGADLFVLPTYSENFGVAVAEALASGLPVITTTGTPWRTLVEEGCGWWVAPTPGDLAEALRMATSLSALERRRMGDRGRAVVQERFGWRGIAEEMLGVYWWAMRGGAQPGSVRTLAMETQKQSPRWPSRKDTAY
jgi:glycosyltransferase involved in cell wall biosynthesis